MTAPSPGIDTVPEPLLDLSRVVAGLRWRRRLWLSFTGAGLLAGLAAALLMPAPATATARIYVVHEESDSGESVMKTDLAVLETTTVATEAVQRLRLSVPPEKFVATYSGEVVAGNVLQVTATGRNDQEAVERAQAVADAFIAVHIKSSEDPAQAEIKVLTDRRSELQRQLDGVTAQLTGATPAPDKLQSLLDQRATLSKQVSDLSQRVDDASLGSPRLVAGTRIIDAPHSISRSARSSLVLFTGAGLFLGLGLGITVALVATVVRDRPVLRRDIASHLGASVIAQLPAPLRGPSRLWKRSSAEKEFHRTMATLVRMVRAGSAPVSFLELGSAPVTARLVADVAAELAQNDPVVLVDDLPGDELRSLGRPSGGVHLVDGRRYPDPATDPQPAQRQLAIGTVGPGAPWTDLRRLANEAIVIVRAGSAEAAWLHTVARQLADAGIAAIGVVVVHPDPRDRSDGTLWDAVHTAIRGRLAAAGVSGLVAHQATDVNGSPASNGVPLRNGHAAEHVVAAGNGAVGAIGGRVPGGGSVEPVDIVPRPGGTAVIDDLGEQDRGDWGEPLWQGGDDGADPPAAATPVTAGEQTAAATGRAADVTRDETDPAEAMQAEEPAPVEVIPEHEATEVATNQQTVAAEKAAAEGTPGAAADPAEVTAAAESAPAQAAGRPVARTSPVSDEEGEASGTGGALSTARTTPRRRPRPRLRPVAGGHTGGPATGRTTEETGGPTGIEIDGE